MRPYLVYPCKAILVLRIAFVAVVTLASCGWTCSGIISFDGCFDTTALPKIDSLFPDTVSWGLNSVLTVNGSHFVSQSQILWNGNPVQTTYLNSHQLRMTITQETFDAFGGSPRSTVPVAVISPSSKTVVGCPDGGTSGIILLFID
jgi:IPT/TIG domain